jgi:hypothetical protein
VRSRWCAARPTSPAICVGQVAGNSIVVSNSVGVVLVHRVCLHLMSTDRVGGALKAQRAEMEQVDNGILVKVIRQCHLHKASASTASATAVKVGTARLLINLP